MQGFNHRCVIAAIGATCMNQTRRAGSIASMRSPGIQETILRGYDTVWAALSTRCEGLRPGGIVFIPVLLMMR